MGSDDATVAPTMPLTTGPRFGVRRTKHYANLCRPSSAKLSPQCSLPLPPTLRPSICVWSSGRLPSNLACETAQPTGASPVEDSLSGPNWTRKHHVARGPLCRNTPRQRVQALLALPFTPGATGPPVKRLAPQLNRLGNPGAFGHGTWAERPGSVSSPLTGAVVESRPAASWAGCFCRLRRHHLGG